MMRHSRMQAASRRPLILGVTLLAALVVLLPQVVLAAGTITGTVKDAKTGKAIPFASVSVKDVTPVIGTVTKEDGSFEIPEVPAGTHTLVVQIMGFESKTQTVTLAEG